MDCPSEEQMIRMKLEPYEQVKQLSFDISNRKLEVFHTEEVDNIHKAISELKLNHRCKIYKMKPYSQWLQTIPNRAKAFIENEIEF